MTTPQPRPLRVLIVGLNYAPEPIGIAPYTTGLAEHLASAGHRVEVIAGRPYYPQWRVYPGFEALGWKRSVEHGVALTRCPHYVPAVPTGARRIIHHLSFAAAALPVIIARVLRERPDVVLCVMPSLVSAVTARIGAWLGRAPLWRHVQDFEVDAAFATGLVKGGLFERALRRLEAALFKSAATVSTISPKMVERLRAKGVAPERTFELRRPRPVSVPRLARRRNIAQGDDRAGQELWPHQRGRCCVPSPAVMNSAVASPVTSAVCHTPGGLIA